MSSLRVGEAVSYQPGAAIYDNSGESILALLG